MDIQNVARLFGRLSTDPAVEAMFVALGVKRRPKLADPPRSPYDAILKISTRGMLLCFTERNYWENMPTRLHGRGDELVFRNVALTSGIPGDMLGYDGPMPFGLAWSDTRDEVRSKMAALGHADRLHAYKRDAWWLPDHHVRVTYQPGDMNVREEPGIFDISLGILPTDGSAPPEKTHYPSPADIVSLFGHPITSPAFRDAFRDFDPDDLAEAVDGEAIDRKREFGFELYFDPKQRAADGTPGFAGIDMTRDRLGDSREWRGSLPFGLHFDDTPAVLPQKVGRSPNQWEESHIWGVARWYLPEHLLWVNFDTLDNRLESIALLAPGYRRDLLEAVND
ncbi:MAG TPA: hypothetical protein VLF18_19830 [Tahibacter sp.]|uniref:hypothetical protein n=1 Tax=Tahibacter sp. TaxID=2056211 RepID=UPI002D0D01AC|nr:hypothetical protein [Tahibacter sp.]HSX62441.1 hypothetical protein [Tahibacter sp.]